MIIVVTIATDDVEIYNPAAMASHKNPAEHESFVMRCCVVVALGFFNVAAAYEKSYKGSVIFVCESFPLFLGTNLHPVTSFIA